MKPNIILIVMDSVRSDALSCYGYKHLTTPNIDAIARDGVICKNAVSNSGWTLPAMASLFTGKFVSHHGACDHHQFLDAGQPTLAEVLSRNGYETIGFSENSFVSRFTGMDRGFKTFHELSFKELSPAGKFMKAMKYFKNRWDGMRAIPQKYCHTLIQMHEMHSWIRSTGRNKQPFFLYMHANQPHYPYIPPKRFREKFIDIGLKECLRSNQDREKYVSGKVGMSENDFKVIKALYDAELAYFDYQLGRLFDFLRADRLFDNTMIIVTADHGEIFGEHNLIGHGLCLYDALIKIPLIISCPGTLNHKEVDQQVQLSDIFPTIMDVTGINDEETQRQLQGVSIKRLREDPTFQTDRAAVTEQGIPTMDIFERKFGKLDDELYDRFQCSLQAIRTNDFKFVFSSNGKHELYNLKEDPSETRNLINALPETAQALQERLFSMAQSFHTDQPVVSLTDTADEAVAKRLKDLGYM